MNSSFLSPDAFQISPHHGSIPACGAEAAHEAFHLAQRAAVWRTGGTRRLLVDDVGGFKVEDGMKMEEL